MIQNSVQCLQTKLPLSLSAYPYKQNVGLKPNIPPFKASEIKHFSPSFRADLSAQNPVSSVNPQMLSNSLDIIGARNLASINIQTDQIALSKLEKEVFEPLKNFKGTNEEFTRKAYGLILKHKGLEDVAPPLVFEPLDGAAAFNDVTCELTLSSEDLNRYTQGDIIDLLHHELDHFEKHGDIACVLGSTKYWESGNKKWQDIGSKAKEALANDKDFEKCAERMNKKSEELKNLDKATIIENLTKEFKDFEEEGTAKILFPEGMEALSKEEILLKLKTITTENLTKSSYSKIDEIIDTNKLKQKEFWTNFVDKKGAKTPEQLDYDIKPMLKRFEAGNQTPKIESGLNLYSNWKNQSSYYKDPSEKTAFEAGLSARNKWDDYLKKNNIEAPKNTINDPRVALAFFDEIDKHLTSKFPEEKRDKELCNLASKALDKLKNKGIDWNDITDADIYKAILEDLEPKTA